MEELIYWGIIFLFYLFSAYRSRQKKAKADDFQIPEIQQPNPIQKKNDQDFNIFEFLDNAVEKSAVEMDTFVKNNESSYENDKFSSSNIEDEIYDIQDDRKQDFKRTIDLKDHHLDHLQSRIETKDQSIYSKQKLLTLQEKLKNKPTKLAIVMKAIFDPPKSQGI